MVGCLLCIGGASAQSEIRLQDFSWLVGTWECLDVKPGEVLTETWTQAGDGTFHGEGLIIHGTDTIVMEQLQILEREGSCYYVANVAHNPGPVSFRITESGEGTFTCENPKHDFPTSIAYQFDGDILITTISGGTERLPTRFRKR